MKQNVRIAKQLIKLAKNLVAAQNVADHEGKYENFTGTIYYKNVKGEVKNADFQIQTHGIIWYNGTWKNGKWNNGFWHNGTWLNGIWNGGQWETGTWIDGIWNDGVWYGGKDSKNNKHGRDDSPDKW